MNIKKIFTAIDSHTEGGHTRIITSGIPRLPGETMTEKMKHFESNLDHVRKLLMCEPRGHKDMFGAVITEPSEPQADLGVFFIKSSRYLNNCVHSAMAVASVGLETGFINQRNQPPVSLDTPAGLISLQPVRRGGKLESITIQSNPVFVHTEQADLDIGPTTTIRVSLVFSDVFFVLVDVKQLKTRVTLQKTQELRKLGVTILEAANECFTPDHPDNSDINTLDAVIFYDDIGEKHGLNIMVSRAGGVDWSPCGAGTGAKMTYLFVSNRLTLGEDYLNEGVIGTRFTGRLIKAVNVGPYKGAIAQVSGSTYITGIHQFILDGDDPLSEGFCLS